jgi:hypothetical protein
MDGTGYHLSSCYVKFFWWYWLRTQGFVFARQVLYSLSHTSSPQPGLERKTNIACFISCVESRKKKKTLKVKVKLLGKGREWW